MMMIVQRGKLSEKNISQLDSTIKLGKNNNTELIYSQVEA